MTLFNYFRKIMKVDDENKIYTHTHKKNEIDMKFLETAPFKVKTQGCIHFLDSDPDPLFIQKLKKIVRG